MRNYFLKLTALAFLSCVSIIKINAQTDSFYYEANYVQTWTAPDCISSVVIDAYGATGGTGLGTTNPHCTNIGGGGCRVQCTLTVTPGQVLNIYVGGRGLDGNVNNPVAGGFNGGGDASQAAGIGDGGSGGGASDIRVSPYYLSNRVVVAAGGGGGGGADCAGPDNPNMGGPAGGVYGYNGYDCSSGATNFSGGGAGPGWGGPGGSYSGVASGISGTYGQGGGAAYEFDGGGGGGGYYGGGGGVSGGGGGGSSYIDTTVAGSVTYTPAFSTPSGNGLVTITLMPCTGVSQVTASEPVTIFPNPADDVLTVQTDNSIYYSCHIVNSVGQTLVQQQIKAPKTTIAVKELAPGIYYIMLHGSEGYKVLTFVKE